MVSCQKGPTRHAYAWQIGPFWQDTFEMSVDWVIMGSVDGLSPDWRKAITWTNVDLKLKKILKLMYLKMLVAK